MYTFEGRYFTGYKTYWHAVPERSGQVLDIEAAVKAFDNEGRVFETKPTKLSAEQVLRATTGTSGHQDVIDDLIRETYERGCEAELIHKVMNEGRQESEAGQDPINAKDAAVEGSGDSVADGQATS